LIVSMVYIPFHKIFLLRDMAWAVYLFGMLLSLWPSQLLSQDQNKNTDSVLIKKASEAFPLAHTHADSALALAKDVLAEALRQGDQPAIAGSYNSIGWAYMHKGHLDSAVANLDKSRELFSVLKSERDHVIATANLAEVLIRQSRFEEAAKYLLEADSLSLPVHDPVLHAEIKRKLGIVYRESGDKERAADYLRQAWTGFEAAKDDHRLINLTTSLSILYRSTGHPDSSLTVLNRGIKLAIEKKGTPYQTAILQENMGETYFQLQEYPNALTCYRKALQGFEQLNNQADIAYGTFCVGKTLTRLNRFAEAEKYLLRSYGLAGELQLQNYRKDISYELAALYRQHGDWRNAFHYLQTATTLNDSLNIVGQTERTTHLKEQYESEKRMQEIQLLKTTNELQISKTSRAKLLQYIFIILFISAIAIIWLLVNKIRLKHKMEKEQRNSRMIARLEDERKLNHFAVSLYAKHTVDDILWDIAENCIRLLQFEDCVVYRIDEYDDKLIQVAAAGPKKQEKERLILNPIEIPLGQGIVGTVAQTGKAEIINNTLEDPRYIVDDTHRLSEITVPVTIDRKVFGIIDSEHPRQGFYTQRHLNLLMRIAEVCAIRLSKYIIEENLRSKIAKDLHDEIGSTLTGIHVMSKLATDHKTTAPLKAKYMLDIQNRAKQTLKTMNDIVWTIDPLNDVPGRVIVKLKEHAAEMLELNNVEYRIQETDLTDNFSFNLKKRQGLYFIFKEAIHNIVKHNSAKNVRISFTQTSENFEMKIEDDGRGFDIQQQTSGRGLRNMQSRAKEIGARLEIIAESGRGTAIMLRTTL